MQSILVILENYVMLSILIPKTLQSPFLLAYTRSCYILKTTRLNYIVIAILVILTSYPSQNTCRDI